MSPSVPAVDPALLAMWCSEHLGSPPAAELFRCGFLSAVVGLRLADDREVVVKVRPVSPRLAQNWKAIFSATSVPLWQSQAL